MPRPRRDDIVQQRIAEIKRAAYQQLVEKGTAGLSLRATARSLGIAPNSIYNYFPNLNNLITALIVDAFASLAEAVEKAGNSSSCNNHLERFIKVLQHYRIWALSHAIEYQLIYGNPIPGYEAPANITEPLTIRSFQGALRWLVEAWQAQELHIPPSYENIPEPIHPHIRHFKKEVGFDVPEALYYMMFVAWSRIHGMIMLELFGHYDSALGDTEAFFQHEIDIMVKQLGFTAPP
ncbi:MAG: TetR/AcrR family transcriptional regulator [Chloroflexota bacterium]